MVPLSIFVDEKLLMELYLVLYQFRKVRNILKRMHYFVNIYVLFAVIRLYHTVL